jgi:putative transposase
MRSRFTQLYLHSVWATWDRMPLLVPTIEQTVYAAILAKCRQLDCEPLAIGGTADHVHLSVRFSSTWKDR